MNTTIMQIRNKDSKKAIVVEIKIADINLFKSFIDNPSFMYTFEEKDED